MASSSLISCNFSTFSSSKLRDSPKPTNPLRPRNTPLIHKTTISTQPIILRTSSLRQTNRFSFHRRAINSQSNEGERSEIEVDKGSKIVSNGSDWSDWTTSAFLFLIYAGLMYYVFVLSPNQTPSRDMYFVKKLFFLDANDGYRMNQVLVSVWNLMGVWPLVYSQLLIPSGRSSKSMAKVWPFILLSFVGGVYSFIPYFILWRPPPPPVKETELKKWPLNFLESKITATISLGAAFGLLAYAGLASGADWKEFYQYFNESKLVRATSIDFVLCSALAPFWVYNDMTNRKWSDKGSWVLPLSMIPIFGPALYILLRPPVITKPESLSGITSDPK